MTTDLIGWSFVETDRAPYDPAWRAASWDGKAWISQTAAIEPSVRLILSWNAAAPAGSGIIFDASLRIDGRWSDWTAVGEWGEVRGAEEPDGPIKRAVDIVTWRGVADAVRVRARAAGGEDGAPPRLDRIVAAFQSKRRKDAGCAPPQRERFVANVPFRSQMVEAPEIAERICGPTSLAMVLASAAPSPRTADLAAAAYDRAHGLYGNWPYLAAVAAQHGFVSWVQQFSRLREVEERLMAGYRAILSVAYEKGELDGAAISRTDGHLLVLRGWEGRAISVCNDPAFPDARGNGVRYRRDQLERVWLRHGGATILLREDSKHLPTR